MMSSERMLDFYAKIFMIELIKLIVFQISKFSAFNMTLTPFRDGVRLFYSQEDVII